MFFMLNQAISPSIYSPNPIVEKELSTYGNIGCGGTYLNPNDYFVYYLIKEKTDKEEILDFFNNEVFFDKDDEIAAEKEIKRLAVEKQDNFYKYYA